MESSAVPIKKRKLDGEYDKLSREELLATIHRLENVVEHLKKSRNKELTGKVEEPKRKIDFSKYQKRHIAMKILYLGWDYDGFVVQDNTDNTIEYHLFQALMKGCLIENRSSCNYHRCGRTDQGVSSFSQVISLTVRSRLIDGQNCEELPYCRILNGLLPNDIRVLAWTPVADDFSARFSCKMRTYKYWFPRGDMNIEKMTEAVKSLIGLHDFRNLCKMDVANGVVDFHRRIHEASISVISKNCILSQSEFDMCEFTISGEAFLWHQIRAIISVLFLVGQEKESPEIFDKLLDIEICSKKPQYNLSSPLPLNLFSCEFEDIKWLIDQESLGKVISSLQSHWTNSAVKCCMLENMLKQCHQSVDCSIPSNPYSVLFKDTSSKCYKPLLSRPTAQSLEDRISHYVTKGKLKMESKGPPLPISSD